MRFLILAAVLIQTISGSGKLYAPGAHKKHVKRAAIGAARVEKEALQDLDEIPRTVVLGNIQVARFQLPDTSEIRRFVKNKRPYPFYEASAIGHIHTYWGVELSILADACRRMRGDTFSAMQESLTEAIKSITSIWTRAFMSTEFSSVNRWKGMRIVQFLSALRLVREREDELLDRSADDSIESSKVLSLVQFMVDQTKAITEAQADKSERSFEWVRAVRDDLSFKSRRVFGRKQMQLEIPVHGFGETMILLYNIGLFIDLPQSRVDTIFVDLQGKAGTVEGINAHKARAFLTAFKWTPLTFVFGNYETLMNWLVSGADPVTSPLAQCVSVMGEGEDDGVDLSRPVDVTAGKAAQEERRKARELHRRSYKKDA